jgi:phage terminase small subunit
MVHNHALKRRKVYRAPAHLRPLTRAWWRSVNADYELDDHHRLLLTAACEALDRAEEARLALLKEGSFFTDRHGARKVHPAVNVERDNHALFARILRELQLDTNQEPPRPPVLAAYRRPEVR